MSNQVRCAICLNGSGRVCSKKKVGVHPNKSRICATFELDDSKVIIKDKPESTLRPDWYWDKNTRRTMNKALRNAYKNQQSAVEGVATQGPDCLTNFRSSAT